MDINSMLSSFNDVISSVLDVHAPIRTIKIRSRPCPYVTLEIKQLMKRRNNLHRRFLQTRDPNDWQNYKNSRKEIKVILQDAERNYISSEVQQHRDNPSSLWKIISRVIPSKDKEHQVYSKDRHLVAEEFNQYFSSVGRNTAKEALHLADVHDGNVLSNPTPIPIIVVAENQFNLRPVSSATVRAIIISMPSNKSPGPDKINMRVIKDCLHVILEPLTSIINRSLTTSEFPDAWKIAELIPLLKEGDHEVPSNNQPLSLLNFASKVCERVVLDQFSCYLMENNRLSPRQCGNRKKHSTETLNISVSDKILEAMDKKKLSALILLDLSKAFDSVSHTILLQKLSRVGASPDTVNWFCSYLSRRSQYVRIGSAVSSLLPITHGVPQGAILSPLLFSIYVNDLPQAPQTSDLDSFVDDSKVLLSFLIKDLDQATINLEEDLARVANWCSTNQLLPNPSKTKFILIGTRQLLQRLPKEMSLTFLGEVIKPITSASDLGVTLDNHLTFDSHITKVVSSCMSKLCQINRVKSSFDHKTLLLIISSLVMSKLLYCSSVWANTSGKNIEKLQKVQNFACRIVCNIQKYDHVSPAMRQLNWLPIKQQLVYKDTVMAYKCLNKLAPPYLCDKFVKRSELHSRQTRNNNQLDIPQFRTASGQRTFYYRAVKIWNSLENELREIQSLRLFKRKLKTYLLDRLLLKEHD